MRKLILGLCAAALLGGCTAAKNLYHTETAKDWCRREVETAQQTVLGLVRTMLEEERIQVAQEEEDLI